MYLYEIFEHLSSGEFGGEAIGNAEGDGIQEKDHSTVISFINAALVELYKKFNLKESQVTIQQYEQISTYYLLDKYAASNAGSPELIKYILDSVEDPFVAANVLRINKVLDAEGEEVALNDCSDEDSFWSRSYNSIEVPTPSDNVEMFIMYRAKPDKIPSDAVPESYEVELPYMYLEALLSFVASRYYLSRPGFENRNASAEFRQKYRIAINELELQSADQQEISSGTRLVEDGWV